MAISDKTSERVPPEETDRQISRVVRILLSERALNRRELSDGTGISTSSLSRSLADDEERHRDWKASDVRRLALFFRVDDSVFYSRELTAAIDQKRADTGD